MLELQIDTVLKSYRDPFLDRDYLDLSWVKKKKLQNGVWLITISLAYPAVDQIDKIRADLENLLAQLNFKVIVEVNWNITSIKVPSKLSPVSEIKNIIAIASAKGGVGKSTIAVNLALALSQAGARVGLLDADIYGPSQPSMLGIQLKPERLGERTLKPLIAYGLQVMSIGFLVDEKAAMIWRGPMVSGALQQLLNDTQWKALDYLIIDLPPGTGDIQLTLAQKIPVTAAVMVTTPQTVALQAVQRGMYMFKKLEIPLLGLIENMSIHHCSKCGHTESIYGTGGAEYLSQAFRIPLLGKLPLDKNIQEDVDHGCPTVVRRPHSSLAQLYRQIACKAVTQLLH